MSGAPAWSPTGATDTTGSVPPPGSASVPEAIPPVKGAVNAEPRDVSADRTQLDGTRVVALLIDGFLLLPVALVLRGNSGGWDFDVTLVIAAISLSYFFICETLFGQTLGKRVKGLRVLRSDGQPAPVNAVAARTVLRVIDALPNFYLVGVLVMILSGKRRQRIGDLVAGTIVTRAAEGTRPAPPSTVAVVAYPAAWLAMALVGVTVTP